MRWHHKLSLRLRSLFRKRKVEQELHDELRFHLQSQTDDYLAHGMLLEDARSAALRSMGGVAQVEQECRDMRGLSFLEIFVQDLRYGFRMLRRNPGFSIIAILCLALGIGANGAVFSWVEGLLLRPFPTVAHQDRLVVVVGTTRAVRDKGSGQFRTRPPLRIRRVNKPTEMRAKRLYQSAVAGYVLTRESVEDVRHRRSIANGSLLRVEYARG